MKRNTTIMHSELAKLITSLKHGDLVLVTDAGCPTPSHVPCIELAITHGVPSIELLLTLLDREAVVERIIYAEELRINNPELYKKMKAIYTDVDYDEVTHRELVDKKLDNVKCSIRTGEFSPWGNIVLVMGTDPFLWFADESVVVPEFYVKRFRQIKDSGKEGMFDKSHFTRKM